MGNAYYAYMNNSFKRKVTSPIIEYFGRRKAARVFSKPPIIIGGCGRSGTTLLLSILSAHPEVHILPWESRIFAQWRKAKPAEKSRGLEYLPNRPDRLYRNFLAHSIPGRVNRWCEKTPSNILYLPQIMAYFNNRVKFIHLVRDGRDVMTSIHPDDPKSYWVSPERWVRDTQAGLDFENHPSVLTIKYEDLMTDHQQSLKAICEFTDLDFCEEIQNWHQHATLRKNQAWFDRLKKPHTNSIRKWEKPEHAERLKTILSDSDVMGLLEKLGYL